MVPINVRKRVSKSLAGVILAVLLTGVAQPADAIVGGKTVKAGEYPFAAIIAFEGKASCGGSLVHVQWIVTAAHCVYGNDQAPEKFTAVLDYSEVSPDTAESHSVMSIWVHPKYDPDDDRLEYYDIALLRLDWPSTREPIRLATAADAHDGQKVRALGWGTYNTSNSKKGEMKGAPSPMLRVSDETIVSDDYAEGKWDGVWAQINNNAWRLQYEPDLHIAATAKNDAGTCLSDSGGPLIIDTKGRTQPSLVGTVAYGPQDPCGQRKGIPGVYTQLTEGGVREWLLQTITWQRPTAIATYSFNRSYRACEAAAPSLIPIKPESQTFQSTVPETGGLVTGTLEFGSNSGLSLATSQLLSNPNDFSISSVARLDEVNGWRRLVDFKSGESDSGLYQKNGRMDFYPKYLAPQETIEAGQFFHYALTRDSRGTVRGYVNGELQLEFVDTDGLADLTSSGALRFFADNDVDGPTDEASSGSVDSIEIFDHGLSAAEVKLTLETYECIPPSSNDAGSDREDH